MAICGSALDFGGVRRLGSGRILEACIFYLHEQTIERCMSAGKQLCCKECRTVGSKEMGPGAIA